MAATVRQLHHRRYLCAHTNIFTECILCPWRRKQRIPAWRVPWTEDPGGLQSMGSQRVRDDLETKNKYECTAEEPGTDITPLWNLFSFHSATNHVVCKKPQALNKSYFLKEKRKEKKSHKTDKGNRRCNRKSIGIQLAPWPRRTEPMSLMGWWPTYGENEYYIVHTHLNRGSKAGTWWTKSRCTRAVPLHLRTPSSAPSQWDPTADRPEPPPPGENWSWEKP